MINKNITVALIVGGTSPEREVSKESGHSILTALHTLNYNVKIIDPAYGLKQPDKEDDFFSKKDYSILSNRNYVDVINSSLFDDVDIAFLGLHGKWGEDGTIQSLFELRGVKYTGAGVLPSSLAMDKEMSKIIFRHQGIKTPNWLTVKKNGTNDLIISKIKKDIGYPCIIKPNDQGSTIGLSLCEKQDEINTAITKALEFSNKVMIEEFIEGREITVSIVGSRILPVLEIKPKHQLYDYECKYTDGMSEYEVPADIPKNVEELVKQSALKAYNSIGCESYGRVDFLLNKNEQAYCLEVNTLPGMTSHSLVPKMAQAGGISFEELVDMIIKSTL